MHPQALSRSAFPQYLMQRAEWRLLGSVPAWTKPDAGRGANKEDPTLATDLFVAARIDNFSRALPMLMAPERHHQNDQLALDFCNIEDIRLMLPEDRLKNGIPDEPDDIELVLHYNPTTDTNWHSDFVRFAKSAGIHLEPGLEFYSRNLLFMAATGTRHAAAELAQFTFIRAIRPLPAPRPLERPRILRSAKKQQSILPASPAIDPRVTIAIFDGGLPSDHPFKPWANAIEPTPDHEIGDAIPDYQAHGLAVTSAALFGSIEPNVVAPTPYCKVDHYRVLGTNTLGKKGLYRALALIDEVLAQRDYEFISLSIGPPEPMDNDVVSPWTILLDDHLGDGSALAAVAAGNNGGDPAPACRLMAPADSVNALGVGSCNASTGEWARADYSAIGPGRSPGLIKPDLLHFGGTTKDPYLFAGVANALLQDCGTSFATPGLIRVAAGVRAHFGAKLTAMSLKALLIHAAEQDGHPVLEVGWGRGSHELESIITCPEGHARIVYSGKLIPGAVLRAPVLVPPGLSGDITIQATLCYSCATDPNTPGDYTRAGLDITFRPNRNKFAKNKTNPSKKPIHPASDSFFKQHDHLTEDERRLLAQKWNTVMQGEKTKRVSSLHDPCFDLHYVAREPGRADTPSRAPDIHYALVISLIHKRTRDIHEKVLEAFPLQVAMLEPVVSIEASI